MNMKSIVYSGFLLLGLVVVSIMLNRGTIQGVSSSADISLNVVGPAGSTLPNTLPGTLPAGTTTDHIVGQAIAFSGSIAFAENEQQSLNQIRLVNDSGPQALDVSLPLGATSDYVTLSDSSIPGTVQVKVTHTNITASYAYSTLGTLSSTVPGTLPTGSNSGEFEGGTFKGLSGGGSIRFDVKWSPGVFLDPRPEFTLIPDTDLAFTIPTLPTPVAVSGTALPASTAVYTIPTADASTAANELPASGGNLTVPTVAVTTNITGGRATVPDLPALDKSTQGQGFSLPDLMSYAVGASKIATSTGSNYPEASLQFTIPTTTADSAPAGVGTLPASTQLTDTGSVALRGIASATSTFWLIKNNSGSNSVDQIVQVLAAAPHTVTHVIDAPSSSIDGIAYANNNLYVLENEWHWSDSNQHRIYKFSLNDATNGATNLPTGGDFYDWEYAADLIFSTESQWSSMSGITTTGADSAASLWIANEWGDEFYKLDQDGNQLTSKWLEPRPDGVDGIAYSSALSALYTVDAGNNRLEQWDLNGNRLNQWDLVDNSAQAVPGIRGITIKAESNKDIIHVASSDGGIYRTYAATAENPESPRGITYAPSTVTTVNDQNRIWVLVDGTPVDKIVKLNGTTGAVVTWLDSTGRADAPDADTVGITYMGGSIYVVSNKSSGCCDNNAYLYKINSSSGAVENTYNLQDTAMMWGEVGGISNDGTNLIVHKQNDNEVTFINPADGSQVSQKWTCCANSWGGDAVAYHSERQQVFIGKSNSVVTYPVSGTQITDSSGEDPITNVSSIRGMTFNGDNLIIVESNTAPTGGKVSMSFFADTATTKPKGITYSPSTDATVGEALWVVVDGEPKDKILKLSTTTGTLLSKTNASTYPAFPSITNDVGWVAAPSGDIEGIAYMPLDGTSYLWVVGKQGWDSYLYKMNATTGALTNAYNLNNFIWDDIGGITSVDSDADGTMDTLYVFMKQNNKAVKLDISGNSLSAGSEWWPCCPMAWGAKALAHHTGRGKFYTSAGNTLVAWDGTFNEYDESFPTLDGSMMMSEDIEGMVFASDMLFVGYTVANAGHIAVGALKPSATNDVQGLAYSPAGSNLVGANIGSALWAVVDGEPYDKLLKLSTTTGALLTSNFPSRTSETGWIDLPINTVIGVTYLEGYLYVLGAIQSGCCDNAHMLYKLNASSGAQVGMYDLGSGMLNIPGHDAPGGISNDGTSLIVFSSKEARYWEVNPATGAVITDRRFCCDNFGSSAVARRAGTNQLVVANGASLRHMGIPGSISNSDLQTIKSHTLTGLTKVQGAVIDNGSYGSGNSAVTDETAGNDLLYLAHDDGSISVTGLPSDKTNVPNALTTDGYNMYIVVETIGDSPDHVIVTTATSSAISNHFALPERGDAEGITYLGGDLYVAIRGECDGGCHGPMDVNIWKINPTTGVAEQTGASVNEQDSQGRIVGLTNDGTDLIATGEQGRDAFIYAIADGSRQDVTKLFDPNDFSWKAQGYTGLVRSATSSNLLAGSGNTLYQFDSDGRRMDEWDVTGVTSVQGLALLGTSGNDAETVYMVDSGSKTFRSALIPKPATVITKDPRGLTIDLANASSTDIYMVIDATPVDKIVKVSATGTIDTMWGDEGVIDAPGSKVKGITYHDGFMWVLLNDPQFFQVCMGGGSMEMCMDVQGQVPSVHKLSTTTAEFVEEGDFLLKVPDGSGIGMTPPPEMAMMGMSFDEYLKDKQAGSITSNGSHLYIGMAAPHDGKPYWLKVAAPSTAGSQPVATPVFQFSGTMPKMKNYRAMTFTGGNKFPEARQFVVAGKIDGSDSGKTIARFDADNVMYQETTTLASTTNGQFEMSTSSTHLDIRGLAYATSSRLIYIADDASNEVRTTLLPENTGNELTPVGSYSVSLRARMTDGTTYNSGITASTTYAIIKNPEVKIKFASLEDGFVATSSTATISGYINDPSITSLSTGFMLPSTTFIDDTVQAGTSTAMWTLTSSSAGVNWHLACENDDPNGFPGTERVNTGACAWRFGAPNEPNFRNGEDAVSGSMTSVDVITVSDDTELTFYTGYMTESMQDIDQKIIEVAEVSVDAQGNATTSGTWYAVKQIIGKGAEQFAQQPVQVAAPTGPGAGAGGGFQDPGMGFQDPNMGMGYQDPGMGFQDPNMGMGYQDPNMGGGFQQPGAGGGFQDPNMGGGFQDPNMGGGFQDPNMGGGFQQPGAGGGFQDPNMGGGFNDPYGGGAAGGGFQDPNMGGGFSDPGMGGGFNDPGMGGGFNDPGMGGGFNDPGMGGGFNDPGMGGGFNDPYGGGSTGGGFNDPYGGFNDPMMHSDESSTLTLGAGFAYKEIDPLFVNPDLVKVTVPLNQFEGKKVRIRFRFNSVDGFANDGEGWFIDDVKVTGSGEKKVTVNATPLDTPVAVTEGSTTTWYYMAFETTFDLEEGLNTINVDATQGYDPFAEGAASVYGYVDFTAPVITMAGLPDETNVLVQTLNGTIEELKLQSLTVQQTTIVSTTTGATSSQVIYSLSEVPTDGTWQTGVSLKEGANVFLVTATDSGTKVSTSTHTVILDTKAPNGIASVVTITSAGEALVGDKFFVVVAAQDDSSGMSHVTQTGSTVQFQATSSVPAILYDMHGLSNISGTSTTHITLSEVPAGMPVGDNDYTVTMYDKAGNSATTTTSLTVVSSRTNRNYFLFPEFNYMGLALIPDDGLASTTDDSKLDRLMTQDVTNRVSDEFVTENGGSVTLGDVVEQVNSYIETTNGGAFVVYSPGEGAQDTLTDLKAFQGMTIKTQAEFTPTGTTTIASVFRQAKVEGFSATQAVPIKYNIQGVFFKQGQLPPDKELRVGYNLVSPHILSDTAFTTVYRGALIPKELAVSALTFERDVEASVSATGVISATVTEAFSANSGPDFLKPTFSYWTYIVDDPDDTRVNVLGTQKGPTITP